MKRSLSSTLGVLAASVVALSFALVLSGCGDNASEKESGTLELDAQVTIGTLATEDILPMWVAEDEGLFEQAGLNVTIQTFQSATELIAAVTAGEVDYAMTDIMVTASICASGTDAHIQWITLGADASQGRFGIMSADPSVTSLQDLAGEPIGVGSNTILEYVMDRLFERAGIAQDQVVVEEMQKLPVRYEAMASGQVKAAALPASLLALGEANGCTVIADDTEGANISQSVMIARADFLAQEGASLIDTALKDVWADAATRINANPESYRALLVEKANLSDAIAETYPVSTYPMIEMPTQDQVDDVLSWMTDKGYLSAEVTYDASTGIFSVQ